MNALIIIDVQNDFIPGGALAVPGGDQIIPIVNKLQNTFDLVLATQDWHPKSHASFASNNEGHKVFSSIDLHGMEQVLWPDHCIQGTSGAEFPNELETTKVEAIFRKGMDPEIDSYSGFYDNGHRKNTGLTGYLRERKITDVYFCGLAADYCVYFSIKDALKEKFKAVLIEDATRAIDPEKFKGIREELLNNNVRVIKSTELL